MSEFIEHPGVVTGIKNKVAEVQIKQDSACASCQVKSACVIHSKQDMVIEVPLSGNSSFNIARHPAKPSLQFSDLAFCALRLPGMEIPAGKHKRLL